MTKGNSSKFNIRPSVHQKLSPKQLIQSLPSPQTEVHTTSPGPGRTNTQHVHGRTRHQRRDRTLSAELWLLNEAQRRTPTSLTSTHSVSLSIASATPTDPQQRHPADSSQKRGGLTNHLSQL